MRIFFKYFSASPFLALFDIMFNRIIRTINTATNDSFAIKNGISVKLGK